MASYCIFSALYLPHMGGVERFTDSLARELSSMGHHVTIITSKVDESPSYESIGESIVIHRLDSLSLMGGRLPIYKPSARNREVLSTLARNQFDGVLINTRFYPLSLVGLSFARKCGAPAVVLDHGSAYLTFDNRVLDMIEHGYEHAITFAEKLFHPDFYGISERSCEWLRTFGIRAKGVIPNAINAEAFRGQASGRDFRRELGINRDTLMLVFTGRLIPEKGIQVLLDVMSGVTQYDVQLVLAGEGPLRPLVEQSGLPNVHLVGRLDSPDIAALLLQGDLFVLPSRSEGFCTSLLEASACGTPSIVTDVGGARELIPDECYGWVVNEDGPSSQSFFDALSAYVTEGCRHTLVAERDISRWVEVNYSWHKSATTLIDVFSNYC